MITRRVSIPRTPRSRPNSGTAITPEAAAALAKFRALFASIRKHNRSILEQCGIGALQLRALSVVQDKPDMGVSELAKALMIRQPSASKVVDELVSRGMLWRRAHPTDGRATVLRLRKAGADSLAIAPGPHWGLLPDALDRMEPDRLRRLDRALSELLDDMKIESEDASMEPLTDS